MRGSVQKKGKRYYVVYVVDKRQKWERVTEPNTKRHAEQLLAQRIAEIDRGEYVEIKKVTFREFAARWLSDYVDDPNHIKASSATAYRSSFEVHLIPAFAEYALTDVRPEVIQAFISKLSKAGLSPQTIKNTLTPLTTMFKHAVQWGYLRTSPMPFVERPKVRRVETAHLTPDEVRRFLQHVPEDRYAFYLTAVMTGMRIGELLAMRWSNLDLENGQYHIRERVYMDIFDVPKSRASIRSVDLTPSVVAALTAHRARQAENKLRMGEGYRDEGLIFCQEDGTSGLRQAEIRSTMKTLLAEAGCPVIRFHGLRHTYASLLIAQGESPKYIQRQLGHSSVQMTFDLYGHLMPEMHRKAAHRLDEQVFGTA